MAHVRVRETDPGRAEIFSGAGFTESSHRVVLTGHTNTTAALSVALWYRIKVNVVDTALRMSITNTWLTCIVQPVISLPEGLIVEQRFASTTLRIGIRIFERE